MKKFGRPEHNAVQWRASRGWREAMSLTAWQLTSYKGRDVDKVANLRVVEKLSAWQIANNTTRGTTPGYIDPTSRDRGPNNENWVSWPKQKKGKDWGVAWRSTYNPRKDTGRDKRNQNDREGEGQQMSPEAGTPFSHQRDEALPDTPVLAKIRGRSRLKFSQSRNPASSHVPSLVSYRDAELWNGRSDFGFFHDPFLDPEQWYGHDWTSARNRYPTDIGFSSLPYPSPDFGIRISEGTTTTKKDFPVGTSHSKSRRPRQVLSWEDAKLAAAESMACGPDFVPRNQLNRYPLMATFCPLTFSTTRILSLIVLLDNIHVVPKTPVPGSRTPQEMHHMFSLPRTLQVGDLGGNPHIRQER